MEDTQRTADGRKIVSEVKAFGKGIPGFSQIMRTFRWTRMATWQQVVQFTGQEERELVPALERTVVFRTSKETGEQSILGIAAVDQPSWQSPGALPRPYQLESAGAAYLRAEIGEDIRACGLSSPEQVGHALTINEVVLKLKELGVEADVERVVRFDDRSVRLDIAAEVPGGYQIVEVEQSAEPQHLRRICELLKNRVALYASSQAQSFLPGIKIIFHVSRTRWPRTRRTWQQAIVALGKKLPFQILATTLTRFASFESLDEPDEWEDLTDAIDLNEVAEKSKAAIETLPPEIKRPADTRVDIMILAAYEQEFKEQVGRKPVDFRGFVDLIEVIARPSLWGGADGPLGMEMPRASLSLLRRYLMRHPSLREALQGRLVAGMEKHRWGVANTIARIMTVVRAFLAYFGLSPDHGLWVRPHMPNFEEQCEYHVTVQVKAPWPGQDKSLLYEHVASPEPQRFEGDLQFVLHLILRYPEEIGLERPNYL